MEEKLFTNLKDYLGIQCSKREGYNTAVDLCKDKKTIMAVTCVVSNGLILIRNGDISASINEDASSFGVHICPSSSFNSTNKDVEIYVSDKIEIKFEEWPHDHKYHHKIGRMIISNKKLSVSFNDLGMPTGANKVLLEIERSGNNYLLSAILEKDTINPEDLDAEGSIERCKPKEPIKCSCEEVIANINQNNILRNLISNFMNLVRELSSVLREKILESYPWIKQFIKDNNFPIIEGGSPRKRIPKK